MSRALTRTLGKTWLTRNYVASIRDALIAADPTQAEAYRTDAAAYSAKLAALDEEISRAIGKLPKERRRIVSTHDAFGYFYTLR